MDSKVDDLLEFDFKPIVLIKTDEKPENAIGPKSKMGIKKATWDLNALLPFYQQA